MIVGPQTRCVYFIEEGLVLQKEETRSYRCVFRYSQKPKVMIGWGI
jgi:hypothetical protein